MFQRNELRLKRVRGLRRGRWRRRGEQPMAKDKEMAEAGGYAQKARNIVYLYCLRRR